MVGGKTPSGLGTGALLDFRMDVTLEGQTLSEVEVAQLLAGTDGLSLVRGQWVTVDREKLGRMLDDFRHVEGAAAAGGLSFAAAMRMLAGADGAGAVEEGGAAPDWSRVVAGPWLAETLKRLRSPEGLHGVEPGETLRTALRPYQQVGARWLYLLSRLPPPSPSEKHT